MTKTLLLFTFISIGLSESIANAMEFSLQPQTDIELLYNEFKTKDVKLNNLSEAEIQVSILDSTTYKAISTFNIEAKTSKTFTVSEIGLLKIYNPSDQIAKMSLEFVNRNENTNGSGQKIKLVLANPSHLEYVLKLPSGAKPKLGPGSNTGMFFSIGEEIYFYHEGNEYLLIKIDDTMKDGDEISIHKLAKAKLETLNK